MKSSLSKAAFLVAGIGAATVAMAQTPPSYYERPTRSAVAPVQQQTSASVQDTAPESYPYMGAGLGYSRFTTDTNGFAGTPVNTNDESKNDFAFKLYGGYKFNKVFGLEGGWMTLGETNANYSAPTIPGFSGDLSYSSRAVYLAGTVALPITPNLSVYGKVGPLFSWVKTNYGYTGFYGSTYSSNTSDTHASLLWGGGVDYYWNRNFGVRLEYENYGDVFSGSTGSVSAQAVFLGLNFRF